MEYYKNLIQKLNSATKAYDEGNPIMDDMTWDKLYYELEEYERVHGFSLPESPTRSISYEVVNELKKVEHSSPMLSLAKTKSINELNEFIGDKTCFLSLKLDGLTLRLTYAAGRLIRAETRGNGIMGEDVIHNARVIKGIPERLKVPANLVIDGEVICTHEDFEAMSNEYKNSRNFAAGSLRLLDARECAKRNLTFVVWDVVEGMDDDNCTTIDEKLLNLTSYGRFYYVPFEYVAPNGPVTQNLIDYMVKIAKEKGYPIDGLVVKYCNIAYGKSLGATAHHWRNGIAFKFFDESYPSTLRNIEWSMGRTGQLTPVAIFDPIEMDGSTVSRASVHNLSILEELAGTPFIGDTVYVFKSNEIIPQISKWEHGDNIKPENALLIPTLCPYCGGMTILKAENNSKILACGNPDCESKLVNRLDHFCSKDRGLDIRGLSKATLEKLIEWGWVNSIIDLYRLERYEEQWIKQPGFGAKSVQKMLDAIQASRTTTLNAFICSLGIPLIGRTISKQLLEIVSSYEDLREKVNNGYDFSQHNGFGYEKSRSLLEFDYTEADRLYKIMTIKIPKAEEKKETLSGLSFCITGKLKHFKNREELIAVIEKNGGRFVKSVSKNINYLINNDALSTSSKNREA